MTKGIICEQTSKILAEIMDTYCWINSTFSVVGNREDEADYGLGNSYGTDADGQYKQHFYHSYYQWLPYFFFLQAITFYIPHLVWKVCEGGKLKGVTQNIRGFNFHIDDKLRDVGRYINQDRSYICSNRTLAIYVICESVNLINMMIQCRLLNIFLGVELIQWDMNFGEFFDSSSPKWSIMVSSLIFLCQEDKLFHFLILILCDQQKRTFPILAKCTYHDYGPSGEVQKTDSVCLLPINMFNEKIFLVLWLYLNVLTILTVIGLCCVIIRVIGFRFLPSLHVKYMHYFQSRNSHEINLIHDLTESSTMSDFFLYYLLEKNICRKNFMRLLKEIQNSEIEDKKNISVDYKSDDFKSDNGNDSSAKSRKFNLHFFYL